MNVSIVIPAYNEEQNISKLLDNLIHLKSLRDFEIVVVNDNSSDKTGFIADSYAREYKNIRVLNRKKGINGMGAALKDGTKAAKGKYIVWVMGDNSDDLTTISKFIDKLDNSFDIVFGSRYMKGGSKGDLEAFKALLSSGYTTATRVIFGLKVHDITNAFRAFKKKVFESVKLEADNFAISPEFAIKAHLKGFRLSEVPTVYSNRQAGQTKFKFVKMGIEYCKLFKYKFKNA